MISDLEQRIKEIDKEIVRVSILESPGAIVVGLALYAIFAANGDAFLPVLNNLTVVYLLLAIGAAIMIWGASKILRLSLEKARLQKEKEELESLYK